MRRALACFVTAVAVLALAPATATAKDPNGQPFQDLQGQVDALQASVDSFFDIVTEMGEYYGVDSFFDVFVELRTTQEQADANTANRRSYTFHPRPASGARCPIGTSKGEVLMLGKIVAAVQNR